MLVGALGTLSLQNEPSQKPKVVTVSEAPKIDKKPAGEAPPKKKEGIKDYSHDYGNAYTPVRAPSVYKSLTSGQKRESYQQKEGIN